MPQQVPEALLRSLDPQQLRRMIRRRLWLLGLGVVIMIVGAQLDVSAYQLPSYTPTVAVLVGAVVGGLGLLGVRVGSGCLAQVLGAVWLSALVCNTSPRDREPRLVLAGAVVVLSGIALALSRQRRPPSGLSAGLGPLLGGGTPARPESGGPPETPTPGTVIDTQARETGPGSSGDSGSESGR